MSFSESGKFQSPIGRRVGRVFFLISNTRIGMKFFVFKNFQEFSGKFQLQLLFTVAERQNLNPRIIFAAFGDIYTDFDDTEQKLTLQKKVT